MAINWSINQYDSVDSTQNILKTTINDNPKTPEGTVICATTQNAGYGRHGRVWEQGAGNLYLSFLVKPDCDIDKIGQISLLTGLALANAIDIFIAPQETILKWPNDALIENKKCSGIIIEAIDVGLIIGVGVNIKSAPLEISTCLNKYSNIELEKFRDKFLSCFSSCYTQWQKYGFKDLQGEWAAKTYSKGTDISVRLGGQNMKGKFESIDIDGNLLLMCDGEIKKITSGEVFLCY